MLVLFYECYLVLSKIFTDKTFVKQALNGVSLAEKDRAKVTKIVYGVLDKNIELDYYISKLCQKQPKNSIKIILKIAFYNLKYLNKKPYAVTDATVGLLKKMGKGGTSGFVNAVLRKFSQAEISLPNEQYLYLSVKYSYPLFAVKILLKKYTFSQVEEIISYDKANTYVRFKNVDIAQKYLKQFNGEPTPFETLFLMDNFKMEDGFYCGDYTFQSIGSVAICNVAKGQGDLLDCCSAPGGKSVFLAEHYNKVVSLDIHEHRVELIKSYANRMGVSLQAMVQDATVLNKDFLNSFDTVLCDVPCSGMGVIKDNPDIKLNRTQEDVLSLVNTQMQILKVCSNYVKVGGRLVYSTCSILPQENEENIAKFLKENTNFVHEETDTLLPSQKEVYGTTFLPNVSMGAGFYCCSLRRVK